MGSLKISRSKVLCAGKNFIVKMFSLLHGKHNFATALVSCRRSCPLLQHLFIAAVIVYCRSTYLLSKHLLPFTVALVYCRSTCQIDVALVYYRNTCLFAQHLVIAVTLIYCHSTCLLHQHFPNAVALVYCRSSMLSIL